MAKPTLHAIRGKQYEWECSACKTAFSGNKMYVVNVFGAHVRQMHKPAHKEDFSQAAARVVREATKD